VLSASAIGVAKLASTDAPVTGDVNLNVPAAQDNNALDTVKAHNVAAADTPTQAPATAAPTDPVTALLLMPGTLIQAAAGLLAAVVTPLLAPFAPATPTETPLMWGVLAWARRQFDMMLGVNPDTTTQTPTALVVNNAAAAGPTGAPVTVNAAGAPAAVVLAATPAVGAPVTLNVAGAPAAVVPAATPAAGVSANTPAASPAGQTLTTNAALATPNAVAAAPTTPVSALVTTVGAVANTAVGALTTTVGGVVNNTVGAVVNTLAAVLTPNVVLPGDQTAALQAQLDALKAGQTLTLQANTTYQHSGVLYVRVAGVTINGNGATLQATSPYTSALQLTAANVTVNNLNLTAPAGYPRIDGNNQTSLVISGNGATINDVTITNSASAGVIIGGVSGFSLNRVNISNTMADGVQMTGGASNGQLNNVTITNSGDDAIAIVSYTYYGYPLTPISSNIAINNPVINGSGQRGITVAGADTVTITNPTISNTNSSGIYIGSQFWYPLGIQGVNNVTVTGGTVNRANTGILPIGAITVVSVFTPVTNVTISGLTITNTPSTAFTNIGVGVIAGSMSNVAFRNITIIEQPELVPVYSLFASYTASGFTMNGRPINA
jgi:hypothetical protein